MTSPYCFFRQSTRWHFFTLLGGLALASISSGQTAPATSTTEKNSAVTTKNSPPLEEDALLLSPFEVNSGRDEGFIAASALAGGRLSLELKDVPVAYSVITREFIDALGITDLNQAAEWTTNSMKFYDGQGGGDTFNITAPITTRGVGGNTGLRQRNFFVYFAPMDSYAIERYDFGRGPNQVLFGNGTVGGTSVSMTKRARFDRTRESIELTAGSWDNYRTVVDVNHPVTKRLAVRAAAVWGDRNGWRSGESESTKGLFLTTTYKLTPKTEVRLEGEIGKQSRRTPYSELFDNLTGWDGVSVFAGVMTDAIRNGTTPTAGGNLLTFTGEPQGVDRRGSNYFIYNPASDPNTVFSYQNDPFTRGGGATARTPIAGLLQVGTTSLGTSGASILNSRDVPETRFGTALSRSKFFMPSREFTLAPPEPTIVQRFKDVQLTLSHQFGDNVFVEVAGDINRVFNRRNLIEGGFRTTFIDINQRLPNGANNPNYLQPYVDAQYRLSQSEINAESVRGAVAYVKDLGKWGNYSFNLMGGLTHRYAGVRNQFLQTGLQADHRQWANGGVGIRLRQYWNQPSIYPVPPTSIAYVDPITPANSRTINPFWAQDVTSFNNANDADEDYNYVLGAMNAKFFKGRLVLLAAVRKDVSQQEVRYTDLPGDYPLDWNGNSIRFRPEAPADWSSLTYTPKNAAGVATGPATIASVRPRVGNNQLNDPLPQYASDRFQDDYNPPVVEARRQTPSVGTVFHATKWMSFSANYAKAFAFNASAAPDPNNQLLPAVQGKGWDAAVRFSLLQGKLNASVGYYSNEEFGNYIDPNAVTGNINGLYNSNALGDVSSDGRTIRNANNISGVVRDTRTRIVDGYEFEVIANLTKGWRVSANYALPKVWQKEFAPITRAYVAKNADLFVQILNDAGGVVGADGVAVLHPNTALRGIDAQNAVNAYNGIYTNLRNFLPDMQIADFQPIVNVFTDYTFQSTRLKGLRVGLGVNYRGKKVLGYRGSDSIVDPANPAAAIDDPTVDGHHAVWAPEYYTVTATAGYRWRLKDSKEVSVNLRVANLLDNDDIIYTGGTTNRPRDGNYNSPARAAVPSLYAYLQPLSFSITATLKM